MLQPSYYTTPVPGAVPDPKPGEPLIRADRIATRISGLGEEISSDYRGRDPLFLITLKGAFVFASDLLRKLPPETDARIEFVRASSYGDRTVSSGSVRLVGPDPPSIQDRDVLILEDILDTGRTLTALDARIRTLRPRSVEIAALLVKERRIPVRLRPRYVGFHIPDVFVVGYGLDYAQRYRHLPDIHVLKDP
jgi:hypoxanthine phosphoribosyltransferase